MKPLDKIENITAGLTAVTMKDLLSGVDREGWRLVGMKWATPNELNTDTSKSNLFSNHLVNRREFADCLGGFFPNDLCWAKLFHARTSVELAWSRSSSCRIWRLASKRFRYASNESLQTTIRLFRRCAFNSPRVIAR